MPECCAPRKEALRSTSAVAQGYITECEWWWRNDVHRVAHCTRLPALSSTRSLLTLMSHPCRRLSPGELEYAAKSFASVLGNPRSLSFFDISPDDGCRASAQKEAILNGKLEGAPERRAQVVAANSAQRIVYAGSAPIDAHGSPAMPRQVPNVQPPMSAEEYAHVEALSIAHPPFRAACATRGIDPAHVRADPWCVGWHSSDDSPRRRLALPIFFVQERTEDNLYARPLEGITMRIDLWAEPPAVIAFHDAGPVPVPPADPTMNFPPPPAALPSRPPLRPLMASQPEGASFSLSDEGLLRWQRWEALVSFTSREGAVLQAVRFDGRPVAWRLSFAEMVVPYGDPQPPHYLKAAFDAGEDGLGRNVHSLDSSKCDCLPGARPSFLDACVTNADGSADVVQRAVCVHEEDGGLLWKHLDWRTGQAISRRNRKVVIMFLCTIANYTYGFSFKLTLDPSIEMEARHDVWSELNVAAVCRTRM